MPGPRGGARPREEPRFGPLPAQVLPRPAGLPREAGRPAHLSMVPAQHRVDDDAHSAGAVQRQRRRRDVPRAARLPARPPGGRDSSAVDHTRGPRAVCSKRGTGRGGPAAGGPAALATSGVAEPEPKPKRGLSMTTRRRGFRLLTAACLLLSACGPITKLDVGLKETGSGIPFRRPAASPSPPPPPPLHPHPLPHFPPPPQPAPPF